MKIPRVEGNEKKLIDIGFCFWFSMDLEFIQDGLKDIGRMRGSILYQSTGNKVNRYEAVDKSSSPRFVYLGNYGGSRKIPAIQ